MGRSVQPRALSEGERALLEFLLTGEFPGRDELKSQADATQVVRVCECGCGTVDLKIDGPASRATCREPIPVEAYGAGVDVLLFVRDGFLSSLEIVDYVDGGWPTLLPRR